VPALPSPRCRSGAGRQSSWLQWAGNTDKIVDLGIGELGMIDPDSRGWSQCNCIFLGKEDTAGRCRESYGWVELPLKFSAEK
jgi:hypothetical protein